jgi:hypothetical protein
VVRRLLSVFLLPLLGGCEFGRKAIAPPDYQVVVHSVLNPDATSQLVLVERTLTGRIDINDRRIFNPADVIASGGGDPISGARVLLQSENGDSVVAVEESVGRTDRRGRGMYRLTAGAGRPFAILQGQVYRLVVRTQDGRVVTGQTRVPVVTSPATITTERFDRSRDTLRLRWTAAQQARTYFTRLDSPFGPFYFVSDSTSLDLSGSLRNFFADGLSSAFIPGFRQTLVVSAVDTNFYNYYRTRNDPFTGTGIISHLDGGFGFIGALVIIETRLLQVDQPFTRTVEGVYDAQVGSNTMSLRLFVEQQGRDISSLSASVMVPQSGLHRDAGGIGFLRDNRVSLAVLGTSGLVSDTADVFTGVFAGDSIAGQLRSGPRVTFRKRS